MNDLEKMKKWGDCRETSLEIVKAIWEYRKTERGRQRVWETPTKREMKIIPERAFENYEDDDELVWGGILYREDYKTSTMIYQIQDREAGNFIDEFQTLEEAEAEVDKYEKEDGESVNFYEIVEITK